MADILSEIAASYGISVQAVIQPFGSGLINHTWRITDKGRSYILQKINSAIFKCPEYISYNIELIAQHLGENHPGYYFVTPVKTLKGKSLLYQINDGYYRLFPFVPDSYTFDVAQTPQLAFEAGKQFGAFTKMLSSFPAESLQTTLPDFHNLALRYDQFQQASSSGNPDRIVESTDQIKFLNAHSDIVAIYNSITTDSHFKVRVTHHDTKISNVLFDKDSKGICVIDLDTVMPGYFISDIGDMLRTYLSPTSEEEKDFAKIEIREDYFTAILSGYLSMMSGELSNEEINHFVYAGKFMIYMQALRFLGDYLQNDVYYGAVYPGQNYVRACNQIVLLQRLLAKENTLSAIVAEAAQNHFL